MSGNSRFRPFRDSIHERRFVRLEKSMGIFLPGAERWAHSGSARTLAGALPLPGAELLSLRCAIIQIVGHRSYRAFSDGSLLCGGNLGDEIQPQFELFRAGRTLPYPSIEKTNARLIVVATSKLRQANEFPGLLDDERAVHEEEGLLRDGRL